MCECYTCKNSGDLVRLEAYSIGFIEASRWFLNWAEANKIKMGKLGDNDIGGIYAEMMCNYQETLCYLASVRREMDKQKTDKYNCDSYKKTFKDTK